MTTIHTDDVRKLPDRIKNMIGDSIMAQRIENEVYSFVDVAILINKRISKNGEIERFIDQIGVFNRTDDKNTCSLIFNEGTLIKEALPESIRHKMAVTGIPEPFEYIFI